MLLGSPKMYLGVQNNLGISEDPVNRVLPESRFPKRDVPRISFRSVPYFENARKSPSTPDDR